MACSTWGARETRPAPWYLLCISSKASPLAFCVLGLACVCGVLRTIANVCRGLRREGGAGRLLPASHAWKEPPVRVLFGATESASRHVLPKMS